ncbi:MAG TPA: DUF58 domain-containing protein [Kofleriaceae bacterium]|jgi:uncharacterized protein (DUF58 family)|nr:DUF58 domain-containing protein [Kofleriaceae bacterium]
MIPSLATRGKLVLASAALMVLVGAFRGAPPLVAMGGGVLIALLAAYLGFYPTAVLLRRKKIELSWWVPPGDQPGGALAPDRPFQLHIAYRNHGSRTLRVLATNVLAGRGLDVAPSVPAAVPAGKQVEHTTDVRPAVAGYQVLHGAVLVLGDLLGLFEVHAYFPNPIAVKVFPRPRAAQPPVLRMAGGVQSEQVGLHQVRRRGLAGELRELREHAHGDPFKYIAWKATARRGKLMTRDLENELVATHVVCVDLGAAMRTGPLGKRPLDWATDTAAALARAAIGAGDRVGLVTFDTRTVLELRPGSGHHHWLQLVDRLLDAHTIVDEDLTDLTAGELVATVAAYLAHQEAIDVRIRVAPPIDDPRWNQIQAGPDGVLYDLGAMARLVQKLLEAMGGGKSLAPSWWWSRSHQGDGADPQLGPLRLFCRLRGLELPYRRDYDPGRRSAGFAQALERAVADGRPDQIVVLSTLDGVVDDEARLTRALARVRRHAGAVVAVVPQAAGLAATAETEAGRMVAAIMTREHRRSNAAARQLLARHGVRVQTASPADTAAVLLGQRRPVGGRAA